MSITSSYVNEFREISKQEMYREKQLWSDCRWWPRKRNVFVELQQVSNKAIAVTEVNIIK